MAASGSYLTLLQQLMPKGRAWPREPDAEFTRLLEALALELERVDGRGLDLLKEADPRQVTEMLAEWEAALGLPDATAPQSYTADRHASLHGRYAWHGGQDVSFYRSLARSAGYPNVVFSHYTPFICTSPCTTPLRDWHWRSAWLTSTEVGRNPRILEWITRSNAQLHAVPVFDYTMSSWLLAGQRAGAGTLRAIAHGSGRWVLVGDGPEMICMEYDAEGVLQWLVDDPLPGPLNAVAFAGGVWVAVGALAGRALRSTSGAPGTWAEIALPTVLDMGGVVSGDGVWVVVGAAGTVCRSMDAGVTFDARQNLLGGAAATAVCWTGLRFVAVNVAGGAFHSPDGGTWVAAVTGVASPLRGVTTDPWTGRVVAVGDAGVVIHSDDGGATWAPASVPPAADKNLTAVDHNGGAVFLATTGDAVYFSTDGDHWRAGNTIAATYAISARGPLYLAAGGDGRVFSYSP